MTATAGTGGIEQEHVGPGFLADPVEPRRDPVKCGFSIFLVHANRPATNQRRRRLTERACLDRLFDFRHPPRSIK